MTTIDQEIKRIATEYFPDFSYIFDDMYDADQSVSRMHLPAIVHVLPLGGTMTVRNGKVYEVQQTAIAFFDIVRRDASGDDQRVVFERMKLAAKQFIMACKESEVFAPITSWSYQVLYNQLASIVTGVVLTIDFADLGMCVEVPAIEEGE